MKKKLKQEPGRAEESSSTSVAYPQIAHSQRTNGRLPRFMTSKGWFR
jgi:hypothetical protein